MTRRVAEAEPEVDPRYDEAYDAIERGDLDAAAAAYRSLLDQSPVDADAQAGLGQVELLRRTQALDERAVRRAAAENPDDVAAQIGGRPTSTCCGQVEDAFAACSTWCGGSRAPSGTRRAATSSSLFELVGNQDDRVRQGPHRTGQRAVLSPTREGRPWSIRGAAFDDVRGLPQEQDDHENHGDDERQDGDGSGVHRGSVRRR